MLFDILRNLSASRYIEQFAGFLGLVPLEPTVFGVVEALEGSSDNLKRFCFLANSNDLTGFDLEGRDVDHLTIDGDMTVGNELARSSACRSNTEAVHDVIQTALEELDEDLTGDTFGTGSFREEEAELTLENTVGVFSFLLLSELCTILRVFLTTVDAVLSGCVLSGKRIDLDWSK